MKRRAFLTMLAALPGLKWLKPKPLKISRDTPLLVLEFFVAAPPCALCSFGSGIPYFSKSFRPFILPATPGCKMLLSCGGRKSRFVKNERGQWRNEAGQHIMGNNGWWNSLVCQAKEGRQA